MYENQIMEQQKQAAIGGLLDDRGSKTVEENIDWKIVQLKREIERLEASKKSLAPLLGMKIRDVREAMNY